MSKEQWLKENLREGEIYAGLILGKNGERDYHLILLPLKPKRMPWNEAMRNANIAGGSLPTRREQSLLFANAKEYLEKRCYWSCEEFSTIPNTAWLQAFTDGGQFRETKNYHGYVCAVRRLEI